MSWLDSCEQLVLDLPRELETQDFNHLRELALKYKVCYDYIWMSECMIYIMILEIFET